MWVQVLQVYDCDIVRIAGKASPTNFLPQRSIQELRSMVDVCAFEKSMVQKLGIGERKPTSEDIQHKFDQMFQHGKLEGLSEQNKSQPNSLNFISSAFTTCSIIFSGSRNEERY